MFRLRKTMYLIVLTYLSILAFLFFFQRGLQYMPQGKIDKIADGFEEKFLVTADGVRILTWYKVPKKDEKIILYLHGNYGNLTDRSAQFEDFVKDGFGVLGVSYRGYFGSGGKPTEAGLIKDGEAALKFLLDQGFLPKDIVLFGESLGSGIVVQLASRFEVFAVILESPFSSVTSVAQKRYWFAPIGLLLLDKYNSIKFAPKIASPVLIFHGTEDRVVPFEEGKKLFDAINSPKKFIEVQGAGHVNFGEDFIAKETWRFLEELEGKAAI